MTEKQKRREQAEKIMNTGIQTWKTSNYGKQPGRQPDSIHTTPNHARGPTEGPFLVPGILRPDPEQNARKGSQGTQARHAGTPGRESRTKHQHTRTAPQGAPDAAHQPSSRHNPNRYHARKQNGGQKQRARRAVERPPGRDPTPAEKPVKKDDRGSRKPTRKT